jgi:uncharacterized protein
MPEHTNQLIHETSPYLLQHAHNPVNWFAWSEVALNKAKKEDKPILVSIGYAACHWCHVMEKESFENEATAAIMNEHFVNIKIDREERPDLDHIYMDAVQTMTGSGGWPLNVFLTPEGKPFYGGTYFPPQRAFNRPSWQEILLGVARSFNEKREEINVQAENLTGHLVQSNTFGLQTPSDAGEIVDRKKMDEAFQNLMKSADKEWGGFGKAPKFPQTFSIQFLLRYHYTRNQPIQVPGNPEAPSQQVEDWNEPLKQALLSLDKMIEGGIYDQVGGGFARYSTDAEWLAPHFEKMLYDNALLVIVLSEAFQLTKKQRYREVIHETMEFVQRELLHQGSLTGSGRPGKQPQIGFYAALDADSEGEEGKFYVWDQQEVNEILGNEAPLFCDYYDISSRGNWEEKNILRVKERAEIYSVKKNISYGELEKILNKGKKKLLEQRTKRIHPSLDDKIILGWNALMNTACSKAFAATGDEAYRQLAVRNMNFLLQDFPSLKENDFYHTWKNDQAKYPAFLDDYAFLIQALIHLQEITADTGWITRAGAITQFVIDHFSEEETGFFFYTRSGQADVIIRKKEVYDGAIPSGNSVMAYNLHQLSILLDKKEWKQRSLEMVSSLGKVIIRYPGSFGNWACLVQEIIAGTNEIVLLGKDPGKLHLELLQEYIPHRALMVSSTVKPGFSLLSDKPLSDPPSIWLCRNFRCLSPVSSVKALITLINSSDSPN